MNIIERIKNQWYLLKFDIYLHSHHLEHGHYYFPDGGELICRDSLHSKEKEG